MSLTSPEDIKNWFEGVQLYDAGKYTDAISKFHEVSLQNSRILFNIGCCYLTLDDATSAAENFKGSSDNDQHLSVAFFMRGLTSLLLQEYEEAMKHFEQSLILLRGNRYLDYKQLGLKYQLYACEVLANQGVVAYQQGDGEKARNYLEKAVELKSEKKHEQIPEMIRLVESGYPLMPFTPPPSAVFRPPKSYVDNLKKKNYLGKAKVISTENTDEIYSCFSGIKEQIKSNLNTNAKPAPEKPQPLNKEGSEKPKAPENALPLPEREPRRNSIGNRPRSPAPPRAKLPPPPAVGGSLDLPDGGPISPTSPASSPTPKVKNTYRPKPPSSPLPPRRKVQEEERRSSLGDMPKKRFSPPTSPPRKQSPPHLEDLANMKPVSPLPIRRNPDQLDAMHDAIAEQRRISQNIYGQSSTPPPIPETDRSAFSPTSKVPSQKIKGGKEKTRKSSDESIEIEVQYSYIKKIKIPEGCSIDDVYDIIKNVKAPREIDVCFKDDIGRQQRLSKSNFTDVLVRNGKPPKFYCFPGGQ